MHPVSGGSADAFPVTVKEYGQISSIDFTTSKPHRFAVTCSTKVLVYDALSNKVFRTISRFKKTAYGGSFRSDGKLLAVGGDECQGKLFNVVSESQLRLFKGHKAAVRACKFLNDGFRIATFSDDHQVRCWDIHTENVLAKLYGHSDYVRCGCVGHTNPNVLISGSYDHTIRLWDTRQKDSVAILDHGWPVESVLMFPNDALLVSAGGTVVKIWDLVAGKRALMQLSPHHKTVTSLCLSTGNRRLLTGSLDRHVKIYDVATYEVVHTLDYPAPILSIGVSSDDQVVAVGMADGLLSMQHRQPEKTNVPKVMHSNQMRERMLIKSTAEDFVDDLTVEETPTIDMWRHEKMLRRFEFSKAIDTILVKHYLRRNPATAVAVLRQLAHRGGLKKALAGRQYNTLQPLVNFLIKCLSRPLFSVTIIDVISTLFEVYKDQNMDPMILKLLERLAAAVNEEVRQAELATQTLGSLEMLINLSSYKVESTTFEDVSEPDTMPTADDNITVHTVHEVSELI